MFYVLKPNWLNSFLGKSVNLLHAINLLFVPSNLVWVHNVSLASWVASAAEMWIGTWALLSRGWPPSPVPAAERTGQASKATAGQAPREMPPRPAPADYGSGTLSRVPLQSHAVFLTLPMQISPAPTFFFPHLFWIPFQHPGRHKTASPGTQVDVELAGCMGSKQRN